MTQSVRGRDKDFLAACESALFQLQIYVRQGRFSTEAERREAVIDAVSHAVGILSVAWGLKPSPDLSLAVEALKECGANFTICTNTSDAKEDHDRMLREFARRQQIAASSYESLTRKG